MDFNERALLQAEVRLTMTEAELLAWSLRSAMNGEIRAANERGEEGTSLQTLRTVEVAAAALEGATLIEAGRRSEETWTGDEERDQRRAIEEERQVEERSRRELTEAGVDVEKIEALGRAFEGAEEGRTEFSAEEVEAMRAVFGAGKAGKPASEEDLRLAGERRPGENN